MGIELPTPQGEAYIPPQGGPERPVTPLGVERVAAPRSAEISTTERPASQEAKTGHGAGDGFSAAPSNDATVTSLPPAPAAQTTATVSLDDVPVVAADEDLIEKQWVDSAKRIINDTRSDPYQQGEAISRLQTDYLLKRYGKTIASGDA